MPYTLATVRRLALCECTFCTGTLAEDDDEEMAHRLPLLQAFVDGAAESSHPRLLSNIRRLRHRRHVKGTVAGRARDSLETLRESYSVTGILVSLVNAPHHT